MCSLFTGHVAMVIEHGTACLYIVCVCVRVCVSFQCSGRTETFLYTPLSGTIQISRTIRGLVCFKKKKEKKSGLMSLGSSSFNSILLCLELY